MEANKGLPDWGTFTPTQDRGQPSLLVRKGATPSDGPTTYFVWLPPEDLKGQLPEGFGLPFRVHLGPDGLRRVAAVGTVKSHVAAAWLGGFAILCRTRQLEPGLEDTYLLMWFLFQRVLLMREHRRRSFNNSDDLNIPRSGRSAAEENSVIPILVEKNNTKGKYTRVKVGELRDRGFEAARLSGIRHPSVREATHFGLVSYAKDCPLSLPADKILPLTRESLFEVDSSESISSNPEVVEIVYERVVDAFLKHREDTTASFNRWFSDGKNSFVKQIAKQRRARGGELDPDLVRKVLLQLGWDAYQYVAGCLSLQMQAVARSIPEPLNAEEYRIFSEMHLCQPHYGNLALLLLGNRIGFVESVVLDLCDHPGDRHHIEILHRLLQYYAEMALGRREADRECKRDVNYEYKEGLDHRPPQSQDLFSKIAEHVLEVRAGGCPCADPQWVANLKSKGHEFTIEAECARCGERRETSLPKPEFEALGWEVIHPVD